MVSLALLFVPPVAGFLAFIILRVYQMISRMGKTLVDIIDDTGVRKQGYYNLKENRVIIQKGKGKHTPPYKPKYTRDCWLYWYEGWPTKQLKRKLMLREGSDTCVDFKKKPVDFGRTDITALFEANVLTKAGNIKGSLEVPIFLYLLVAASTVISLITLLQVLRFG